MADEDGEFITYPDCTLLMLNRWTDCSTGYFYHPADVYEKSVEAWEGCRIVLDPSEFCVIHPDCDLYASDPEAALKAVEAHDIGYISNVRVVREGRPRLMAQMNIDKSSTWGMMADELYQTGEFGISIADRFTCAEGVITGDIDPNHILVFRENGWNTPADKGAVAATSGSAVCFSNGPIRVPQRTNSANAANDLKPLFSDLFEKLKAVIIPGSSEVQSSAANSEQKIETMAEKPDNPEPAVAALNQQIGALEQDKASLTQENTDLKTALETEKTASAAMTNELETLRKEKAEREAAKQEAAFTEFVENYVPDGEIDTEEKKAALRTAFKEKPQELFVKVHGWAANQERLPGKTGIRQASANTGDSGKPKPNWSGLFHIGGTR